MSIVKQSEANIPTPWGSFLLQAYAMEANDPMPHLAIISEGFDSEKGPTMVRIHSECLTGDLFGSKRCDCGEQLEKSLQLISENSGIIIYLRQEGRGIGLINKLKAYQLQDKGLNTADANLHLGLEVDDRGYETAVEILESLNVRTIRLLTNNPEKIASIEKSGIQLLERIPLVMEPKKENRDYFETKKNLMGHMLPLSKVI